MKATIRTFLAVALSCALAAPASATLTMLGDNIRIERLFPDLSTPFGAPLSEITTPDVVDGTSDTVVIQRIGGTFAGAPIYTWNPEANSLIFEGFASSFGASGQFGATIFNGFRFTGFTHTLLNATLTDPTGLAADGFLSFDDDSVLLNVKNSGALVGRSLTINLTFTAPEPGIAALLVAGLVGAGAARRKRSA